MSDTTSGLLAGKTILVTGVITDASIAFHIDDFQRPWRSAWLGLSSMRTTISQAKNSLTAANFG